MPEYACGDEGPSGERMFGRLRHAERQQPGPPTDDSSLTLPVCLLCSSAARAMAAAAAAAVEVAVAVAVTHRYGGGRWGSRRELPPGDWAVLKDFTCLGFSTSGLVGSRPSSLVNSLRAPVYWSEGETRIYIYSLRCRQQSRSAAALCLMQLIP